jgi:hypothetical protein
LLPFNLHPSLVLHHVYGAEMAAGRFFPAKKIWDSEVYTTGLRVEHYNYKPYLATLTDAERAKHERQVVGDNRDTLTQDALLWYIADKYMKRTNPSVKLALTQAGQLRVANIKQTTVQIPLAVPELAPVHVVIELYFHQLDDILIAESQMTLQQVVVYMAMRTKDHLITPEDGTAPYNSLPEAQQLPQPIKDKNGKDIIILPYQAIHEQLGRIYHSSLAWVGYLLDWERTIIARYEHKQDTLGKEHVKFKKVCTLAGLTKASDEEKYNLLNNTRNCAFHGNVPQGWTYDQKIKDEWLYNYLHIQIKAPRNYEQSL